MTIVETTRLVTGGVDTHLDVHVAAAVDASGGVLGVCVVRDDAGGLRRVACVAGVVRHAAAGWGSKAPARTARAWPVICGAVSSR